MGFHGKRVSHGDKRFFLNSDKYIDKDASFILGNDYASYSVVKNWIDRLKIRNWRIEDEE